MTYRLEWLEWSTDRVRHLNRRDRSFSSKEERDQFERQLREEPTFYKVIGKLEVGS